MATEDTKQPVFNLQTVYLKDLSLEQPNSPQIFLSKERPEMNVAVNVGMEKIDEDVYESVVVVTVTAKIGDKIAYLVEGQQAGIFSLSGFPEDTLNQILSISCPSIVYPYLRANIADMITRAGFPPLHLAEINFESMYKAKQEAEKNGKKEEVN